jgi:DNA-binding response OmpR family regulator
MLPRLLVLEDNDDDYFIYSETLQERFHLNRFRTTADILQHLKSRQEPDYELLVLDLMVPDGYSILALQDFLKSRVGQVPFVLISGRDEEFFLRTTFGLGGLDYIVKPFSTSELLVRIENAITSGRVRAAERTFEFVLPPIQMRILKTVLSSPMQRVRKLDLATRLWRAPLESSTSCLKAHLTNLRKVLPEHGFVLETRSGEVEIRRVRPPTAHQG